MKVGRSKPIGELGMSSKEFERIMGQALQAKPENAPKRKRAAKSKAERKKRNAG
jgi:hypothetical protein